MLQTVTELIRYTWGEAGSHLQNAIALQLL